MYRMNSTDRELWRWTQSGIFQPSHGPNGGVADSLDEAKAAFRAAWDRSLVDFVRAAGASGSCLPVGRDAVASAAFIELCDLSASRHIASAVVSQHHGAVQR